MNKIRTQIPPFEYIGRLKQEMRCMVLRYFTHKNTPVYFIAEEVEIRYCIGQLTKHYAVNIEYVKEKDIIWYE